MEEENIKKQSKAKKIIELDSTLSSFEVPPLQDVLIIGREAPIGTKAMEQAVEFMSQGNYTVISFQDDDILEAMIVKNCILRMVPEKLLVDFIKEEIRPGMCSKDMLKFRLEIVIKTKKSYQL
ncbi:MAG: hypothetical protein WBC21_03090 [Minisyncoccales bacterium]